MRPRGGETALVVCRSVTTPLRDARPLALVVGIVGSLWAGTRVALATGNALDQLWGVRYREQPNWFRRRGKALPMLFLLGGGVVLSTLLAGAATATASYGIPARAGGVVLSLLAVVIGLLSWLYLGAHITLLAAEADIVAANRLWPRSFSLFIERPATEGDRRALRQKAELEERRRDQEVSVAFDETGPEAAGPGGDAADRRQP